MADDFELPEKIDKYEILGVAGRGAMGVVYHGHDPFFDRDVAIKTTQSPSVGSPEYAVARKMLYTEARAAGALNHGSIIQVLDVGEFEGEPYIVMEFVPDATTLKDHCLYDRLLPMEQAVSMIYTSARALHHAHEHGVIHRDIKASNILLTHDGRVKVGDFGIATILSSDSTQILGAVGSPRYMSPEQFMETPLTARTDLYSLGVVLYELLTGYPVFKSRNFAELSREVMTTMPTPVHELRSEAPQALSKLVEKAIAKRPDNRFQSGAEFADALSELFGELDHSGSFLTPDVKFRLARELEFFENFADDELHEFVEACHWRTMEHGVRIIREGNMERSCFVLVSGEVSISKAGQRIGSVSRGSCFGEMGFHSRSGRSATINARGEVTVLEVEVEVVAKLSPFVQLRFNQRLMDSLVERLASTTERLSKFLTMPDGEN